MKKLEYYTRWFFWNVLSKLFINAHLRRGYKFSLTPDSDVYPEPPFLVVSNHGTFFDPWIIGNYSRWPFSIMVNDDGFRGKGISQWYLKNIGCIPKRKGASDYKAMKETLNRLKNGYPVCVFPEGQTTWDGETQLLYKGLEKIVLKMKCPVVTVRLRGNFLTKPWWARNIRRGNITIDIKVHTPQDYQDLTSDQLFEKIKSSIYQNDIKDPQNLQYPFTGTKIAEGLERFVWICMNCCGEDTLSTDGNTIHCSSCGGSWEMDAHCRLKATGNDTSSLHDLKDWADMHKSKVIEKIRSGAAVLSTSDNVILQNENSDRTFSDSATGSATLTADTLTFNAQSGPVTWPVSEIEDFVIQKKDIFEFRHGKNYIRFLFNRKSPMKWVYYLRYLKGFEECERRGYL